jgi:hypothetical protein
LQPHTPLFAREACRRRNPPQSFCPSSTARAMCNASVSHKAAGVQSPAVSFASIGRVVCAGLTRRWGRARSRRRTAAPALRGSLSQTAFSIVRPPRRARHACSHRGRERPMCSVAPHTLFPGTSRQTRHSHLSSPSCTSWRRTDKEAVARCASFHAINARRTPLDDSLNGHYPGICYRPTQPATPLRRPRPTSNFLHLATVTRWPFKPANRTGSNGNTRSIPSQATCSLSPKETPNGGCPSIVADTLPASPPPCSVPSTSSRAER